MCPLVQEAKSKEVWGSLYLEEQLGEFWTQFFPFSFFNVPCWILSWKTPVDLFPLKEPLLSLLVLNPVSLSHPEVSNPTHLPSFHQHLIFSLLLQAGFSPLDGGPKWRQFRAGPRTQPWSISLLILLQFLRPCWAHSYLLQQRRDDRKLGGHHHVHSQVKVTEGGTKYFVYINLSTKSWQVLQGTHSPSGFLVSFSFFVWKMKEKEKTTESLPSLATGRKVEKKENKN